jgi:transposase
LLCQAFGVRGYRCVKTVYEGGTIAFVVEPSRVRCAVCGGGKLVGHGGRYRRLQTLPIGMRRTFIDAWIPRVHCRRCDRLVEVDPPFAAARVSYTKALERLVIDLCRLMPIKAVAEITGLSWDVVKSIEKNRLEKAYATPSLKGVRYLAVDEIAVKRGHRYMTLVMDLESGRVLYVAEGKDREALTPFLQRLKRTRAKVKAISMDMSAAYMAAVEAVMPHLPIVFDRFHVVKLMNERLDELRRAHQRDSEKALRRKIQGVRYLVLMGADKLDEFEAIRPGSKERLREALELNQPLLEGYYLKEKLRLFWEQPDRAAAETALSDWCAEAEATGSTILKKMARTLTLHRAGLLAYFDHHRISSGRMEGVNNKIKTLKRASYGYRDLDFFKLKILGLHEARYQLVG